MLEVIRNQIKDAGSLEEKIHLLRESLQILLLKIIYDLGSYKNIAFVGGTALRILFDLKRFSEDLDFSLIKREGYDFKKLVNDIQNHFTNYGLITEVNVDNEKIVNSVMFKFKKVLNQLELSPLLSQNLNIKLEVDTNPPEGFVIKMSLINKIYVFTTTHYDLSSLYAGKLHACFFRKYIKGRDYYDLLWYLGKKIKPNFLLLNNAIKQTKGVELNIDEENFLIFLKEKLSVVDFEKVRKDVERFIVNKEELKLLNMETILAVLDYK